MNQSPKYITVDSDKDEAIYNNLGIDLCIQGKYDEGIANFCKAIQLKPKVALLYYNRSIAFLRAGFPSIAKVDFETVQTLLYEYAIFKETQELYNILDVDFDGIFNIK